MKTIGTASNTTHINGELCVNAALAVIMVGALASGRVQADDQAHVERIWSEIMAAAAAGGFRDGEELKRLVYFHGEVGRANDLAAQVVAAIGGDFKFMNLFTLIAAVPDPERKVQ